MGFVDEYRVNIGYALAALTVAIRDPDEKWHKAGTAGDLDALLDDLDRVVYDLVGEVPGELPEVDLFVRWGRPVKLAGQTPGGDVGYVWQAAPDERDDLLLALAGLRVFASWTASGEHAWLCQGLASELWLTPGETAERKAMTQALKKAVDARWVRRQRAAGVRGRVGSSRKAKVRPPTCARPDVTGGVEPAPQVGAVDVWDAFVALATGANGEPSRTVRTGLASGG